MKKVLCLILAMLMVLALLPCGASAEDTPVWETDATGTVLKKYNGPDGEVTIPATVNGTAIVRLEINSSLRDNDRVVSSVVIEEGIVTIGLNALYYLKSLEKIVFPQTLQAIDGGTLGSTELLKEVTVPASVRVLSGSFLSYCKNLEKVTFEGPCPFLRSADQVFSSFPAEAVVMVPDDQVEEYRKALVNLRPEQVQPSGKNAVVTELHPQFEFDPATGTITRCTTTDAWVNIPSQIDGVAVRAIGDSAFTGCTFLYGVVIPEGVETIGAKAFKGLQHLCWADVPDTVKAIGEYAFEDYDGLSIYLPSGLQDITTGCYYWADVSGTVVIPEQVRSIGDKAFSISGVNGVLFPAGLQYIGSNAFSGYYLSYLSFDSTVLPSMGSEVFSSQKNRITVELPATATDAELQAAKDTLTGQGLNVQVVRKPVLELPASSTDEELLYAQKQLKDLGLSVTAVRAGEAPEIPETPETPETTEATGNTALRNFIIRCYQNALNRECSEEEISYWSDFVADGTNTPADIAFNILASGEFRNRGLGNEDLVKILYRIYLNREADEGGLAAWTAMLNGGETLETVEAGLAGSDEFKVQMEQMK